MLKTIACGSIRVYSNSRHLDILQNLHLHASLFQLLPDGRINKNFYTKEEQEDLNLTGPSAPVLTTYASLRPVCFELIKGKKTPLSFRFVFHLSRENTEKILQRADTSFSLADIHALVLTIRYDGAAVMCTTGTSLSVFSMDKSVEHAWDDMVRRFFLKNDLAFTEN